MLLRLRARRVAAEEEEEEEEEEGHFYLRAIVSRPRPFRGVRDHCAAAGCSLDEDGHNPMTFFRVSLPPEILIPLSIRSNDEPNLFLAGIMRFLMEGNFICEA